MVSVQKNRQQGHLTSPILAALQYSGPAAWHLLGSDGIKIKDK